MWIITKDHIEHGDAVGRASVDYVEGTELAHPFKLFDDDDNLYYEGVCNDNDSEEAFAPLDDFGLPNAGCTYIQYKNAAGVFETL